MTSNVSKSRSSAQQAHWSLGCWEPDVVYRWLGMQIEILIFLKLDFFNKIEKVPTSPLPLGLRPSRLQSNPCLFSYVY